MSQNLTSLSAQLKRLQVPQTNLLNVASDKRRVSFLYDPKEAANLDSEAVYCVAMNGLEQLKSIDLETFESFELTLFNSSSVTFERAIQTKDVNDKLNQEIRRFLIHLSPYFMLKSAHKVFEWLVFRYQIHLYNLNEMFMCILPYHETNYFVRALQLINFNTTTLSKEHKFWEWLVENQKHGVQLPSTTLATHAYSDLSFLNYLIGFLRDSIDQLNPFEKESLSDSQQKRFMNTLNFIFSFITKTLLQSIKNFSISNKQKSKHQETFLAQILPVFFEGFKSDLIVYKQSSYLLCSFLFEKFKFNAETCNKTLFAISKGLSTFRSDMEDSGMMGSEEDRFSMLGEEALDCVKSAILAICLIVQSQQSTKSNDLLMSKNFLKKLMKNFQDQTGLFVNTVDSLNEIYRIESFLRCLFNRLIVDMVTNDQVNETATKSISLDLDNSNNDESELKDKAKNECSHLLMSLINKLSLNKNPDLVKFLITSLFENLINQVFDASFTATNKKTLPNLVVEYHLCEVIFRCETKYPQEFDSCLNAFLTRQLTNEQRTYFLNTISCRFASFKCKSTFKYQQVKLDSSVAENTEYNLVLSLNHANSSIRANALEFILKKILVVTQSSTTQQNVSTIDETFIREQMEMKFSSETSPEVLEALLKFDTNLTRYFSLEELVENENYLLKLLQSNIISGVVDLTDASQEMIDFKTAKNRSLLNCRTQVIDLLFDSLYRKAMEESNGEQALNTKDRFFNCFVTVMTRLFELASVDLLNHLKKTKFYSDIQYETHTSETGTDTTSKKFYSSSSISLTNLSTGTVQTSRLVTATSTSNSQLTNTINTNMLLNDIFDQYLQICVKFMLSNKQKDKLIRHPKCFDNLNPTFQLIDIIVFEISVRLCAQSLFLTNASFYFSLCSKILVSLFEKKIDKTRHGKYQEFEKLFVKQEINCSIIQNSDSKSNNFTNYFQLIGQSRQVQTPTNLLFDIYTTLFKSINIQTSNFVNLNSKIEIESILNQLYVHLCSASSDNDPTFVLILKKFTNSSFFNSLAFSAATSAPQKALTKISNVNNSNISNSFLQFAFKFLICSDRSTESEYLNETSSQVDNSTLLLAQERTIQLFGIYLKDLVAFAKNSNESSLLNALVLILAWCLTSETRTVRSEALDLLEKCHNLISEHIYTKAKETDDSKWLNFINKLTKHREEILIDGALYVRTKCMNKIFSSSTEFLPIIDHFLCATTAPQSNTFFSNFLNTNHSIQLLNKFKLCVLDLFKDLKADIKIHFMDVTLNLFLNICNSDLQVMDEANAKLHLLFENLVVVLANSYFITSKSSQYFVSNEKHFDYLIGYLNKTYQETEPAESKKSAKLAKIIRLFSETLINKLAEGGVHVGEFFEKLSTRMQNDLVKCFFEIWLSPASMIGSSVIKNCLLAFNLNSKHLLFVFNERVHLKIMKGTNEVATTKQMKKQLKQFNVSNLVELDWKCLKYLLEYLQFFFSFHENKMETDDSFTPSTTDSFIDIIPYLFLSLETIETTLAFNLSDSASKTTLINSLVNQPQQQPLELTLNPAQHSFLTTQNNLIQYLEIMTLSCLLSIYKINITSNKELLTPQQFNIELLMQILQTKRECSPSDDPHIDNLNVQEHVLLLLSEIASVFPDKVLEHVLIMFVFVGTRLARKDDSYSFQIINKIIQTILPSIVNSINLSNENVTDMAKYNNSNKMDTEPSMAVNDRLKKTINVVQRHQKQLPYVSSLVCKILQSFVVALPHIPAHRKTIIFDQLLNIIGLDNYLWITIIQSIDYYLVQSIDLLDFTKSLAELASKQQSGLQAPEKRLRDTLKTTCLQSMISLHVQFPAKQVIQTSVYLVSFLNKYITSLFDTSFKLITSTSMAATNNLNAATVANLNLPTNKIQNKAVYSHLACQLDNYNILQMKYLAYNLLTFVSDLVVSEEVVKKLVSEQINGQSDETTTGLFQELIEKILLLILKLSQVFIVFEQFAATKLNKTSTTLAVIGDLRKFHRAIVNKAYDLMERAISLLDSRQFIEAVKKLIKHDSIQIRRRVLGLLNNKLRRYEPTEEETTLLITMIDDLMDSIQLNNLNSTQMVTDSELPSDQVDIEINNQTILFAIKLLCKRIGEKHPLAFVKVMKSISEKMIVKTMYVPADTTNMDQLNIQNVNLLSSVLLCVGELCLKLKSTALVYLNQIMTFTLDIVDIVRKKTGNFDENEQNLNVNYLITEARAGSLINKNYELLILSCVTCVLKIVQNMSNFISPFLSRIIYVSCSLSTLITTASRVKSTTTSSTYSQIEQKLNHLRSSMATLIPLRLLLPIFNENSNLSQASSLTYRITLKNIEFYMQMVVVATRTVSQEDLLTNIRLVRSMFMNLFEIRTVLMTEFKASTTKKSSSEAKIFKFASDLCKYEDHVIEAFSELVIKLSEDLFKPIFFKLFEWATMNEAPKDRLITFYRTTLKLSHKLKNLFVLFAFQFIPNASANLELLNSSKADESFFESENSKREGLLLYSIVDTLSTVFMNDSQKTFANKDCFKLLIQPLVDQIDNELEYDDYPEFIRTHLAPCIANLATCCVQDDALSRKFNYQILLKTKSSSVQVRLATLNVLNLFSKKIGDIYNSYLSETVPFLAELMEDPVEEVEEKVQDLIKELEEMLGESLQSHFV